MCLFPKYVYLFYISSLKQIDLQIHIANETPSPHRAEQGPARNLDLVANTNHPPGGRIGWLDLSCGNQKHLESVRGAVGGALPFGASFLTGGCHRVVREAGAVADCSVGEEWRGGDVGGGCRASNDLS